MPNLNSWARAVENLVDQHNRNALVHGTLRTRILELMQQAYAAGLDAQDDVWKRRELTASLVPCCNMQAGRPGGEELGYAIQLADMIIASVK